MLQTDVALTSGVGGISYGVLGVMTLMASFPVNALPSQYRHVWLRALVCRYEKSDLRKYHNGPNEILLRVVVRYFP